jgi:hypothetical protein
LAGVRGTFREKPARIATQTLILKIEIESASTSNVSGKNFNGRFFEDGHLHAHLDSHLQR